MNFLKSILGGEQYNQFMEKLNAYNGDEGNKNKQIKRANLAEGSPVFVFMGMSFFSICALRSVVK